MASIELQGDANLTLVVDGTFTVTGGKAGDGSNSVSANSPGGKGGYAGIYVPHGTTLTVRGSGSLVARGGHAGDGGNGGNLINIGGSGAGGAGAGIGGNGGNGGASGDGTHTPTDNGAPGGAGISAGTVYLYETIKVNAYGGAGGSGGTYSNSTPGGAGGYPAAGIGGGGAGGGGGTNGPAGGGFSGGRGEADSTTTKVIDGAGGPTSSCGGGGGYFSSYNGTITTGAGLAIEIQPALGGGATKYKAGEWGGSRGGNGGAAGSGNKVRKASTASLTAVNGSYKTANKQWGVTPTPIYAQSGYDLNLLRTAGVRVVEAFNKDGIRTKDALETKLGAQGKSIIPAGLPGVGSGAGYTETSNAAITEHEGGDCYLLGLASLLVKSNCRK